MKGRLIIWLNSKHHLKIEENEADQDITLSRIFSAGQKPVPDTKKCGRDPTQELERCASKERKSFLPNIFTRKDKFEEKIQVKETGESLLQPWGGYKNDGTGHGG